MNSTEYKKSIAPSTKQHNFLISTSLAQAKFYWTNIL